MKTIDFKDFDFQKHSKKILAAVAAFIIIVDFFLIMKPQINWLKRLNVKNKELIKLIVQTQENIASIKKLQNDYEISKENMADIERRIPQEEDIPVVLQDISSAANDVMIKISQMKPLREQKESVLKSKSGQYYRIPVSIDAIGGYHLFGKFLSSLENSEIFMSINRLVISPSAKDYKRHNINLILDTFIFKND
jgi:type IV pilus assembly protein PilO